MNNSKNQNIVKLTNWVKAYSKDLLNWANFKLQNNEVAKDLVQDTFLAAFRAIDTFKGDSQPKTWLFSILNRKIIDYYRKEKRELHLINEDSIDLNFIFDQNGRWKNRENVLHWPSEEHLLDNTDFMLVLQQCLDDLPSNWKLIIEYKFILEKKADNICQEIGISKTNYWQIIHRAKVSLKNCLEKKWISNNQ